jgi:CRISPR/Cas system-associated protein Cas7 (RAMP superfamily)
VGFKHSWDVAEIANQLHRLVRECSSSHNDGFTAFELKKDLYQIKFIIDEALNTAPEFSGEQEWLTEQEKKRIIKILKS